MKKSSKGISFIGLLMALAMIGYLLTLIIKRDPAGNVTIPAEIGKDLGIHSTVTNSKVTLDAVQRKLDAIQENMKAREELIEKGE